MEGTTGGVAGRQGARSCFLQVVAGRWRPLKEGAKNRTWPQCFPSLPKPRHRMRRLRSRHARPCREGVLPKPRPRGFDKCYRRNVSPRRAKGIYSYVVAPEGSQGARVPACGCWTFPDMPLSSHQNRPHRLRYTRPPPSSTKKILARPTPHDRRKSKSSLVIARAPLFSGASMRARYRPSFRFFRAIIFSSTVWRMRSLVTITLFV
jgi:hypothetical protein